MELTCAACTAPALIADDQGNLECDYCGTQFLTERTECPACGELNLKGADICSNCDEPLSIVARVIDRQGSKSNPLWIRRLQSQVANLKESETRASADRFEKFVEIDRKRMAVEAKAHARQKETDRNILFYGAAVVLLIALVVLVLVAIP